MMLWIGVGLELVERTTKMSKRMTVTAKVSAMAMLCAVPLMAANITEDEMTKTPSIYGFTMKSIDGKDVKLSTYDGGVLLIVNVASQ